MMPEGSGNVETSQLRSVLVMNASLRGGAPKREQLWDTPSARIPSHIHLGAKCPETYAAHGGSEGWSSGSCEGMFLTESSVLARGRDCLESAVRLCQLSSPNSRPVLGCSPTYAPTAPPRTAQGVAGRTDDGFRRPPPRLGKFQSQFISGAFRRCRRECIFWELGGCQGRAEWKGHPSGARSAASARSDRRERSGGSRSTRPILIKIADLIWTTKP